MEIISLANPKVPVSVGQIIDTANKGDMWDLKVYGRYAYVANGTAGLRIYDVFDPKNLTFESQIDFSGDEAKYIAILLNHIYILAKKVTVPKMVLYTLSMHPDDGGTPGLPALVDIFDENDLPLFGNKSPGGLSASASGSYVG